MYSTISAVVVSAALFVLGLITLTSAGAIIGVVGGLSGGWAVWKVKSLSHDLDAALSIQKKDIKALRDDADKIERRLREE